MNKQFKITTTETIGALLALALVASGAQAISLIQQAASRDLLGQGAGGIWSDEPELPAPVSHTDQGPVKAGFGPFGGVMAPPPFGASSGSGDPALSGDLGSGFGSDLLDLDAAVQAATHRIPTVGPWTLFDFEEFTAMKKAEGTASSLTGSTGAHAVPSPGSFVLIGVAGSLAGLRRKRAR